jgi:hypothetical protein
MMTDEELAAHKKAKIAEMFTARTPFEKQLGNLLKNPGPPDLTDAQVIAAVSDPDSEFAATLDPAAVKFTMAVTQPQAMERQAPPANFLDAHKVIIDQLLLNPSITNKALGAATGYSPGWVSRILQSDAFQAKLAEQKNQVSHLVLHTLEARMKGMAAMAMEVLERKLETTESTDLALEVLASTTKALGMGAKANVAPVVQNSFIVHMPTKIQSASEWAAQQTGTGLGATKGGGEVLDVEMVIDSPSDAGAA